MRTDVKIAGSLGIAVITFLVIFSMLKFGIWLAPRFEARTGYPLGEFLYALFVVFLLILLGFLVMTLLEERQRRRSE